ncbi:MAG TPA: DUF1559 domain-containing protein [Pirellulales bacterium]|nr:DUF1559 domain-containing protein [Pirellulales bacterium]
MELFAIHCPTCNARLKVRDRAAIGMILNCPKCGSMVQVTSPPGWQPPPEAAAPKPPRWLDEVPRGETPTGAKTGAASTPVIGLSASGSSSGRISSSGIAASPAAGGQPAPVAQLDTGPPPAAGASAAGGWAWQQWSWLHWSLVVGPPAAALAVVLGVWFFSRPSESPPVEESPHVAAAPLQPEIDNEPEPEVEPAPAPAEPAPAPVGVPRRWLPTEAEAVASFLPAELLRQPAAASILGKTASLWQADVARLLGALAIEPAQIDRITWASTDLGQLSSDEWLASGVTILQLARPAAGDAAWLKRGEALDWKLDEAPVRRLAGDAWTQPVAIVDKQTLVTGPEPVLKGLAGRDDHRLTKPGLEPLVAGWDARDQVLCAVDLSALRRAEALPEVSPLVDLWHADRDDWQLVRAMPQALGLSLRFDEQFRTELDLVCDSPSSAEQLQAAADRVLAAMQSTIDEGAEGLTNNLLAGQIDTAGATELKRLLTSSEAALAGRRSGVRDSVVWFKLDWRGDLPRLSTALLANIPQIEASRLAAARQADEEHHRMLLLGLQGYEKSTGGLPAGAAGAQLLPPETRLSWLATMLPYYDHLDWHEELNFSREWNDAANQRVTRRPLELAVNPALGPSATKAGFPVTHYVGVAGLGADAGDLEASDPRAGVFGFRARLRRGQIPDGASHTIALAGVEKQLGPWASGGAATVRGFTRQPYINGPDGFGSGQPDGMVAGMADGSVRFLSKNIDPAVLARLVTINGGEPSADEALAGPLRMPDREGHVPHGGVDDRRDPDSGDEHEPGDDAGADKERPTEHADEGGEMPDNTETDIAARLDDRIPEIEYKRTLSGLIELLSQISTVPITLDIEALSAAGVKPDARVAIKLANATVGEVLSAAIEPYDLRYVIVGRHVVVTDRRRGEEERSTVRYDVGDLATSAPAGLAELEALLTRFVVPTSWQEAGGTGAIEQKDRTLVIEQTEPIQRQVADLLDRLRLARGLPASRGEQRSATLATRFSRANAMLAVPITATFREPTPLKQIAAHLETAAGIKIVFDGAALAEAGLSPTLAATLSATNKPLAATLDELLGPLKLTYRIVDAKTLEFTTLSEARDELEIEFYPVKKLLAADGSDDELMERIRKEVAHATWDDVGGAATMAFDGPSSCLIVSQSQPVQRELEAWLAKQH